MTTKVLQWFDDRLGLDAIRELMSHKTVPVHSATRWYYFGGITLFLFGIQILTGTLLLFYYRPTVAEGFDSVRFLMTRVEFGWLIRSIHSWSANLLIFVAFVHMFSVVFTHAYRPPRELTWASGIVLLGLMLGFGFSGYLLPWNQISYFATKVGTDVAASTPVVGEGIARILRGGEDVGAATLTRFFALHVMVLPMITAALVALHVLFVQKHGMSTPPWISAARVRQMKFFPNFFLREVMVWYGALAILGALAAIFPWELGEKADPFASAPKGIRPEWYFLAQFYTLKLIPSRIWFVEGELLGIAGFGVLALGWALIPLWGVNRAGEAKTRLVNGVGIFLVVYLAVFTILGYVK
ncbi:MAG TPA: cytochrome b N-terminal domain-containing protein [Bryobacteraceae bacterium]|nr:cytochrome b N-terminal domain-containing protein [Bryobacteraceae bacterium]